MSLDIGQVLGGRYVVERLIGRGVLGPVYQGRDQSTNRHVAIRLIQPEFDNEQVAGFTESEVRAAGQLADRHIARLINIGFLPSGERCVLTEYVEGETLKSRVKRLGRMPEAQVAHVLTQVLEALAASHKAGVSHRDLTPNSVILSPAAEDGAERVTLIDFGISRLQAATGNSIAAQRAGIDKTSLQYLSPEQLSGLREIDPRSNIYSLGAIAYEAVTGSTPFEGADLGDPTAAAPRGDPKPVEELAPESSTPFAQLIRRAMARTPSARFQNADEMLAAIRDWSNRASVAEQPSAGNPANVGGSTRPAAVQASVHVAEGAPAQSPPAGSPISAPPPVPAQAQVQGLTMSQTERQPASARNRAVPPPPPPPPMDPTAADIDQSVVDALFAPPPVGADDDFGPPEADEWAAPPSAVSEPKSAPISELQPPRLEPPSRPSTPRVTDTAFASESAGGTVPTPQASPAVSGLTPPTGVSASASEPSTPEASAPAAPAPEVTPAANRAPSEQECAPAAPPEQEHAPAAPLAEPVGIPGTPQQFESKSESQKQMQPEGSLAQSVTAEPSEPLKRTILGIAPPSHRPSQPTAPGIQPEGLASAPEASAPSVSVPQQPAESQPVSTAAAGSAPVSSIASQPASTVAEGAAPVTSTARADANVDGAAVPSTNSDQARPAGAASVSPSGKPVDAMTPASTPAAPSKPAAVTPVAAAVIMDTADDLGPYSKARSRSRKPLAIAVLLVGLVGGGAALALLQNRPDADEAAKPDPTQASVPVSPRSDFSQHKPSTTPTDSREHAAAGKEAANEPIRTGTSTSLSQAVNGSLSQSVAAVQAKKPTTTTPTVSKPASPEKPAPVAKTSASAKPPVVSKPATKTSGGSTTPTKAVAPKGASKDPYNYR